ncbi:MAG: DUF393 domain-containing protein [wastewater metagenome]|nr:DUF393 domain-containing protein [Candidatus Loosdrechtia aerotolerans]
MNVDRIVLIYDGNCSLCRGSMRWVKLHAVRENAFECIPCQSEERKNRFPEITDEACLQALHVILPDRRILKGDEALPEILSRLRRFRWFSVLFKIPVMKVLLYAVYHWIANNRYIISRTIWPLMDRK